jgi:MFS family permease
MAAIEAIEASRRIGTDEAARTRLVLVAASLGTVFEWYDFFLYGSLAVFFGTLFFPPGNDTAGFLASLATFGAGFAVRPFGALVFGGLGDRIGRKRCFMITMVMMGLSKVWR